MTKVDGNFQYYDATDRIGKVAGTDIANFQYPVNWATMKAAGADFVVLKAGGMLRSKMSCRYIRNTLNGNSVNDAGYFNLIQALNIYGNINYATVAEGATVSGSEVTPVVGTYDSVIDGDGATYVIPAWTGEQSVTVDLGSIKDVYYILMKHYYVDNRIFYFNKIEYSTDNVNWNTLYDSELARRYPEKSCGMGLFKYNGVSQDIQLTAANIAAARAAGIKVGAYWFNNPNYFDTTLQKLQNTVAIAQQNATNFYNYIVNELGSNDMGDVFPMLDLENQFGSIYPTMFNDEAYDYCEAFVNKFKELSGGRQVALYTAYYTLEFLATNPLVHSTKGGIGNIMPLWWAATDTGSYPTSSYTTMGDYEATNNGLWTMWQFSSDGNGRGAEFGVSTTDIDLDIIEDDLYSILVPSKVAGVYATEGDTTVMLNWSHVFDTDKEYYQIYQDGTFRFSVSATEKKALVTGLSNGVEYQFQIAATDEWDIGEKSDSVYATPRVLSKAPGYFQYYNGDQRNVKGVGLDIATAGGQYPMDWATAYSKGVRYMWLKCSQRDDVKDANFTAANIAAARAAGIKIGAYHFNQPSVTGYTTTDAETEADWFIAKMQEEFGVGKFGDIMPMFDFEDAGGIFVTNDIAYDYVEAFINRVKSQIGRQCILYCAVWYVDSFINPTGGSQSQIADKLVHSTKGGIYQIAPLMLAARAPDVYTGVNMPFEPPYPNSNYYLFGGYPEELWTTWQFSSDNPDVHMGAYYGASSTDIDEDLIEGDIYTIMPPSKVSGLNGAAGDTTALITWDGIADTDKKNYKIYENDGYKFSVPESQTSSLIVGLTNGLTYKFQIAAEDEWEDGEKSEPVFVVPTSGGESKVLTGNKAQIKAYGSSISFTDEATASTDNRHYQISDITKRVWCKDCVIIVKDGGTTTTESYTLDRLSGRIIFETTAVRTITVSGAYLPLATIGCAYEYSYNLVGENVDANCFETVFVKRQQALKTIEAEISKFYDIDHYFLDKWRTDNDFVVEFYSNVAAAPDIRAWTKIASDNPSATVDGLVEESISLEGTTDANGNCVSFGPF